MLLHLDEDNCARYAKTKSFTKASDEAEALKEYFESNFKADFEKMIGQKVKDFKEMNSMCSYLQWAQIHNLTLKFNMTEEANDYCLAMGDSKLYHVSYGLDELWKLSSADFLRQMFDFSHKVMQKHQITQSLFLKSGEPQIFLPKFVHYAAHAETLASFFDGLNLHKV